MSMLAVIQVMLNQNHKDGHKMKIFYFDVETSGLDSKVNDILTLSGLIEIDGQIVDTINLKVQPFNPDTISDEALKINGITREEILTFMPPREAYNKLNNFFCKYVDKYKKNKTSEDKLIPAGYNVKFDIDFLYKFWEKNGDKYLGSFIDYHSLDIAALILFLKYKKVLNFHGYKLVDAAAALGVGFKAEAHDAESDILVTREIGNKIMEIIEVKK